MTFYVRRSKSSEITGPFAIEEINQMVREKRLSAKSIVLADTGQGVQEAGKRPTKQWSKLANIRGFEPDPKEEKSCLRFTVVVLIILALLAIIGIMKLMDILHGIH